jgi:hypothetical protein
LAKRPVVSGALLEATINCTASDATSGLANSADASFSLSTTVAANTTDGNASTGTRNVWANNCMTAGPVTGNKIDRQAPTITITSPTATTYARNQVVVPGYSCNDNGGVGGGTCIGPATVDTSTTGSHTYTVDASDALGNSTSKSVTYTVQFSFSGFIGISNTGFNSPKAGDTIPMSFSLNGNQGLSVIASGQPVSYPVNCTSGAVTGAATTTLGFLIYVPSTTLYIYQWSTLAAWKKTCRKFSMTLVDGTTHTALFNFR